MFVYALIYLSIVIGMIIYHFSNKRVQYYYYLYVCTIILAVLAFRHESMGGDTYNYLDYFLNPHNTFTYYQSDEIEPGLTVFNAIVRLFTSSKYLYLASTAIISNIPLFCLFWKHSVNPFFSLFLYISYSIGLSCFILETCAIRQCLAIGFFAMALLVFINNHNRMNWKVAILLVLMIITHYSSVLALIVFLLNKIKLGRIVYFAGLIVSIFILFVMSRFADQLFILAAIINKGFYFSREQETLSIVPLMPYMLLLCLSLVYLKQQQLNTIWFKGFFLSVVMANVFFYFGGNNLERFCLYYYIPAMICIPSLFFRKRMSKKQMIKAKLIRKALISKLGKRTHSSYNFIQRTENTLNKFCVKFANLTRPCLAGVCVAVLLYFTYKYYITIPMPHGEEGGIYPYKTWILS